jgi:hypothetical protein
MTVQIKPPTEKACARCKEVKPASEFYTDRNTSTGLNCYCKPCARAKCLKWKYASPENLAKAQANNRQWCANNLEKQRAINRATARRQPKKVYARPPTPPTPPPPPIGRSRSRT